MSVDNISKLIYRLGPTFQDWWANMLANSCYLATALNKSLFIFYPLLKESSRSASLQDPNFDIFRMWLGIWRGCCFT